MRIKRFSYGGLELRTEVGLQIVWLRAAGTPLAFLSGLKFRVRASGFRDLSIGRT